MERDGQELMAMLRARRELYRLLARLFLAPPDEALLAQLAELPGFAESLPPAPDPLTDLVALQVEYEFVFGRNVYPYESLYVDRDLMLNTAAADRVARLYTACGFSVAAGEAGAPDHLGLELGLMAHLLTRELAAAEGQDHGARSWARARQGRCLHEHLARWAPICVGAIERIATHPLYLTAAQLTTELVLHDLGQVAAPEVMPLEPWRAADGDEEERGINRVVRQLITPDAVGIFLSRGDLAKLGRRLGLPAAIGERFQMLRGLFESAGQFELVVPLLDALDALLAAEAGRLAALAEGYPAWGEGAQQWRARLAEGRALLDGLRAEARAGAGDLAP